MEDDVLGFFKKSSTPRAHLNIPALMQVAAPAITMIRCLGLLMIFNTLGFRGTGEFTHCGVQTWDLALVFLGSLVLLFIEIYYTFSLVKGWNQVRWIYLLTQTVAGVYLWVVSLGYGHLGLFSIAGESRREIPHTLVMQELPGMLVLLLLFVPTPSRRFFRLQ